MNEPELAEVIEVIADKLGIVATELVGIFSEAQVGYGVLLIIQTIVFFAGMYLVGRTVTRYLQSETEEGKKWYDCYDSDSNYSLLAIALVAYTILGFCTISIIGHGVLHIMYPEYYGIQDLISSFASI